MQVVAAASSPMIRFLLRFLFPRRFLWNGGISPYNGEPWRSVAYCENGDGVWSYSDGDRTIHFFGEPPWET